MVPNAPPRAALNPYPCNPTEIREDPAARPVYPAFEPVVIEVRKASASVESAAARLKLDWRTVHGIMERAVDRWMKRCEVTEVNAFGFNETSIKRGKSFVPHMCDPRGPRVVDVVEGCDRRPCHVQLLGHSIYCQPKRWE